MNKGYDIWRDDCRQKVVCEDVDRREDAIFYFYCFFNY